MIPAAARTSLEEALGDAIRFDVPLSRHTALRVGGPADALATPASRIVRSPSGGGSSSVGPASTGIATAGRASAS